MYLRGPGGGAWAPAVNFGEYLDIILYLGHLDDKKKYRHSDNQGRKIPKCVSDDMGKNDSSTSCGLCLKIDLRDLMF